MGIPAIETLDLDCPFNEIIYPNCAAGHKYAVDIVTGEIPSSRFIKAQCIKYLHEVWFFDHPKYKFDPERGEKYLRLAQKFEHAIGKKMWKTPTVTFEPWQKWIWMNIMGWMNKETGYRRYRTAHLEVARGNGKSPMAAIAALYFMGLDDPDGNQVSTVATKKEQAKIVFDSARVMAERNESFLRATNVKVFKHTIEQRETNSIIRPLSSDAQGLDGLNDVLCITDELHAMQKTTFDVVESGMFKRPDSLLLCITTAGVDVTTIGFEQSAKAKAIAIGDQIDETFFPAVYCVEEIEEVEVDGRKVKRKVDIFQKEEWIKANPNFGISVPEEKFTIKANEAKNNIKKLNNFKIKNLNMWVGDALAYYDITNWDNCMDSDIKKEDLKGAPSKIGIDLASVIDITAVATVFKKDEKFYPFVKCFLPRKTFEESKNAYYKEWEQKGWLTVTPGEAINYEYIRKYVESEIEEFGTEQVLYDSWGATETAQKLSEVVEAVKVPMNTANLSEPTKKLDALMRQKDIVHDGNPLLRWCFQNIVCTEDNNQNVFPKKTVPERKIDAAIATIIAMAGWVQEPEVEESVYETRGILKV